jgi:photosystem II stability/assembly factor-like uncharacterized protein
MLRHARVVVALVVALLVGATVTVPLAGASIAPRAEVRPSVGNLTQLAMIDLKVGYGLFVTHAGASCRTYVARTTDGGARFSPLVHLNGCNTSIAADAHGDVYVYGKQLFVSHDDAATFTKEAAFSDVEQVVTLDDSAWLAMVTCPTTTAVSCPLELFASSNGGVSWSLLANQPPGAVGWSAGGGGTYLVRVNAGTGYVLSHPPNVFTKTPLYFTDDAGRSWTQRVVPCPRDAGGYVNATASPRGALWAACAGEPSAGVQRKAVEVSIDEGAKWEKGASCQSATAVMCQGYLNGIAAISRYRAWITSQRGDLLVTHDAGTSFAWVRPIGDAVASPAQVQFFNERDGFAGGTAPSGKTVLLWWTNDGGSTWSVTHPSI